MEQYEHKYIRLSYEQRQLFDTMTMPQLHEAIVQNDGNSPLVLYYLLYERMYDALRQEYHHIFNSQYDYSKSFNDYISDFYLYLMSGSSNRKLYYERFHALKLIKDNRTLPQWILSTFRHMLLKEAVTLKEMNEALDGYKYEARHNTTPELYDLFRLSVAMAIINQNEPVMKRYILFRSINTKMFDERKITDNPDNKTVARILGISNENYRAIAKRMRDECIELAHTWKREDFDKLDTNNLILARSIYDNGVSLPKLALKMLYAAEGELPKKQLEEILRIRQQNTIKSPECIEPMFSARVENSSSLFDSMVMLPSHTTISKSAEEKEQDRKQKYAGRRMHYKQQRLDFVRRFFDSLFHLL